VVVTQQTRQVRTELDLYATRCTGEIRHLDLSAVGLIRKFYEKRFVTVAESVLAACDASRRTTHAVVFIAPAWDLLCV